MGLKDVTEEIISKAKKEADQILYDAKNKEKKILSDMTQKLKSIETKHSEETDNIIEQIRKREISQTNLATKKELMQVKKKILDETFEKAIEEIKSMPDEKRKKFLQVIFDRASKEIDVDEIHCRSEDIKLINATNAKLIAKPMIGGMVITSKDKNIVLDYSYDTMLDNIRNNELQKIAGILF